MMGDISRWGAAAAVYLAAVQGIGTYLFRIRLDYPHMSMAQRFEFMNENLMLFWYSGLVLDVGFGLALVVLLGALHARTGRDSPGLMQVAGAIGLIWAGLRIAGGLVEHAGIMPALVASVISTAQAPWLWAQTEALSHALTGADGQVVGGVMTLLIGRTMLRTAGLSRLLGGLAIVTGLVGILSALWAPAVDLIAVFALAQGLWFLGLARRLWRAD